MTKKRNLIKWIFGMFFLAVGIYFILGQTVFSSEFFLERDFCNELQVKWLRVQEDGSRVPIEVPGKCKAERKEKVTVETILPFSIKRGSCLCFQSSRQDMEIYINGMLRQEYTTKDTRIMGNTSASALVFVDLTPDDAGKKITVVTQSDSSFSGVMQTVFFGDELSIWKHIFVGSGAEVLIAFIMFFVGVVSVLGSLILRYCYNRHIALVQLGCGVLCAAVWIITNSKLRQLMFSNLSVVSDIPFFMVMFVPFPFLLYMDEI